MVKHLLFGLLCIATCCYIYVSKTTGDLARLNGGGLPPDALQYINNAQQLGSNNPQDDRAEGILGTVREPAFPLLLAAIFSSDASINNNVYQCLKQNESACAAQRLRAKKVYSAVIFLTALSAAWMLFGFTGAFIWSYLGLLFVASSQSLWLANAQLLSEPLASFLLLWSAYFLAKTVISTRIAYHILAGATAAMLALTKIAFSPMLMLYVLVIAYRYRDPLFKRNSTTNDTPQRAAVRRQLLAVGLGFLMVMGGWSLIKQVDSTDQATMASRGASVLNTRANYNRMTAAEYGASFIYWSSPAGPKLAAKLLPYQSYAKLDRANPTGYFRGGSSNTGASTTDESAKNEQMRSALGEFIASPIKHLLVSLPIFYRGLFVETGFDFGRAAVLRVELASAFLVGPILMGLFFYWLISAYKSQQWDRLMFCLPVAYSLMFHSLMTHNIPRYGVPLIPVLIIASLMVAYSIIQQRRRKT